MKCRLGQCFRSHPEPGWSIGEEWSARLKDLDLWLVLDGRGWMRCDGEEIELRPGVALVARPGREYEAWQDPAERLCVDAIHFDLLDEDGRTLSGDSLPPRVLRLPDLGLAESVSRRLRERFYARASDEAWAEDEVAALLLKGFLLDLEQYTRQTQNDDGADPTAQHRRVVERAYLRIYERPAEQPTVAELAAESGYSPDHFARIFRSITGRSPQTALIYARLDRARYLLRSTPMTISQVAAALNYTDVFFFSRQFKRFTGQTPSGYRRES
ncbi:MAG: AraC family transcriptional regulator [Planctomycetota bacterium]